jgi:hypothetical protein
MGGILRLVEVVVAASATVLLGGSCARSVDLLFEEDTGGLDAAFDGAADDASA